MTELEELRQALDQVDRDMVALFEKRMTLARRVAQYKRAHGLPVLDRGREEQVLSSRCGFLQDAHYAPALREMYEELMALSRREQKELLKEEDAP